jgi:hypothetical protein
MPRFHIVRVRKRHEISRSRGLYIYRVRRVERVVTARRVFPHSGHTLHDAPHVPTADKRTRRDDMTTWRELGYVPASDGEDSDAELSTQEDEFAPLAPPEDVSRESLENETTQNGDEQTSAHDVEGSNTNATEQSEPSPIRDDGAMDIDVASRNGGSGKEDQVTQAQEEAEKGNIHHDDLMDVDHVPGVTAQPQTIAGKHTFAGDSIDLSNIPVVDLSNLQDDDDDENGGVGLQVLMACWVILDCA